MTHTIHKLFAITLMLSLSCCFSRTYAMADKDNKDRWTLPTKKDPPDIDVPGFLVNLGPTGARGILKDKSFVVKYIFKDSPADGRLKLNDEIIGVFGKPFSEHTWGGRDHGYDGPIMEMGDAIEQAEGKDGKLIVNVKNGSNKKDVVINLEPIGFFSPTFPHNCKKSALISARAQQYLADHPDAWKKDRSHTRSAVILALLTSDNPKHQAIAKDMARNWSKESPNPGTWTWDLSFQLITLSEYYNLTKDDVVLPMIKTVVGYLEKAQYSGKILVWAARPKEDQAKVNEAEKLYDGSFGHRPYMLYPNDLSKTGVGNPGTGKLGYNGYGPMQYPTILALTAWQLAGQCDVKVNHDNIKRAIDFIHRGTTNDGYVCYGTEFIYSRVLTFQDPEKFKQKKFGIEYVGRAGAAIVAHKLSPEFADTPDYLEKYYNYAKKGVAAIPDGHADSTLGIFWSLMGAGAASDESLLRTTFDYHKAFFNMMRCFDGSFVVQPTRSGVDGSYYKSSRFQPTGTMALAFGLGNPKLLIQGIQVSIPGINPKALTGKLDTAYKAIIAKSYDEALRALKTVMNTNNLSAEDSTTRDALLGYVTSQFEKALAQLEPLEQVGDFYRLDSAFKVIEDNFKALENFNEHKKVQYYKDSLKNDQWKNEVKLGAQYDKLVANLTRSPSDSNVRALEKFAEKNTSSLYGKWAGALAENFRTNGVIIDPATQKTTVSGSSSSNKA